MIKQPHSKIALVGDMLGEGGAERVQARLSIYFEEQGVEVHHIIVRDIVAYQYAGTLFNMGKLKNKSNGLLNKLKRLLALKKYLKDNQFDYIIDFRVKNGFIQEYIIANWIYKAPYVMSLHSFETAYYFPKNNFLASIIYKKAYGLVTVSKMLEEKLRSTYHYKKIKTIYNPIVEAEIEKDSALDTPFDFNYILGVGRMKDNIKQFDHLIKAFMRSDAISSSFKLVLMGDGAYKNVLVDLVQKESLENHVVFLPYMDNPFPYIKNAYLMALTSKNEGFPNVLIESLACGVPLVAYDCESGPGEIILNENNGLLVKNQDIDRMAKAMSRMINNTTLHNRCASNSRKSIQKFNLESIGREWLDYLKITTE
jgi:glycosyltransferase involved in cell wall biosynthesis